MKRSRGAECRQTEKRKEMEQDNGSRIPKDSQFTDLVMAAIRDDEDFDGDDLIAYYEKANLGQKAAIDCFLMALCGWTYATLQECVRLQKHPDDLNAEINTSCLPGPLSGTNRCALFSVVANDEAMQQRCKVLAEEVREVPQQRNERVMKTNDAAALIGEQS